MDAINFGSGWFPTLRKRDGLSGYNTIAAALRDRFDHDGGWSAAQLTELDAATLGAILGQDPQHELMALYATSLRNLGDHIAAEHGAASPLSRTLPAARPSPWPAASAPGRRSRTSRTMTRSPSPSSSAPRSPPPTSTAREWPTSQTSAR